MTSCAPPADRLGKRRLSEHLNQSCFCISLDKPALWAALKAEAGDPAFCPELIETRPHLFSTSPVFLSKAELDAMLKVVAAIEATAELPGFREAALAWAPPIARQELGPRGAFMGYDFHLGPDGPRLIEVNTNAGGAFLNAFLAKAQQACCTEVEAAMAGSLVDGFEDAVWAMFLAEWRRQGRDGAPTSVAIVDDDPTQQYLYPEFVLARRFFERRGLKAHIVDPRRLTFADGRLRLDGVEIDLVYNRLVDFGLEAPEHAALREAYANGAAVVTPNPRNHALFADKRNLILLSDSDALRRWGLGAEHLAALCDVPRSRPVTAETADDLWSQRKGLFFKPAAGHGGKAVYRGDKLTRGVWAEIVKGGYIAQDLAPPTERIISLDGELQARKLDVRLFTYAGSPLLAAARLYQGQTTNFRTPGGGFAPVFPL